MSELLRRATYLLSEADPQRLEPSRAEVAFIGRSNVGKSSVINALCQKEGLAKISKTPGRTRTINVFAVDHLRWIVDLPGYGYAAAPNEAREGWAQMVQDYFMSRSTLTGVFVLIDSKIGPTQLDHQMRSWLEDQRLPHFFIGNKVDQVKPSLLHAQQKQIAQALSTSVSEIQWVSATKGTGMGVLRNFVAERLQ